jgi:aldose 1-epimerase
MTARALAALAWESVMRGVRVAGVASLAVALAQSSAAQPYSTRRTGDVIRLEDASAHTVVSIARSVGNIAFEMTVRGTNVLWWPFSSVEAFTAAPVMSAIPFLGPWANRLDEQAFYANGIKYAFDMELGNVRGAIPIHGFLTTTGEWRLVEVKADAQSAWATSRLDFYRQPTWMKQFPFAHVIEMTYRLERGVLEVRTSIRNLSADPMPVAIGYHPYFRVVDSARDEWTISVGARTRWVLTPDKVPNGQTQPIEQFFPNPRAVPLKDYDLDDVFSDLVRDATGRAAMSVTGRKQKIEVLLGPNWRSAVVWAPRPTPAGPDRQFLCFEPMAAITDAMNLSEKGLYKELQSIRPGAWWHESFWIRPAGF